MPRDVKSFAWVLSYELRVKLDAIELENPLIQHGVPALCCVR
jgi:hypothetical protein